MEVVGRLGAQRWSLIASQMDGRVGKQCRERWFNHLCPEVTSARPAACYPRRQPTGPEPYAVGIEVATPPRSPRPGDRSASHPRQQILSHPR